MLFLRMRPKIKYHRLIQEFISTIDRIPLSLRGALIFITTLIFGGPYKWPVTHAIDKFLQPTTVTANSPQQILKGKFKESAKSRGRQWATRVER